MPIFAPARAHGHSRRLRGGAKEEGFQITLEIIEKIKGLPGIHGLHIMPVGWDEIVPRIVVQAGLGELVAA